MASLKETRIRIASVSSTRQITSAMKMVSAAKLRKAQDAIIQLRPYAGKLHEVLMSLVQNAGSDVGSEYGVVRRAERILIVMITSNKGLCGAFNSNVVKRTVQLIQEDFAPHNSKGNVHIIAVGKKGHDLLKAKKIPVIKTYHELFEKLNFDKTIPVTEELMEKFLSREYDRIYLVYNQFKNAAVQILTTEQFLPVAIEVPKDGPVQHHDFIYEPSMEEMIRELVPKSLRIQFFKALLDSVAAEHGARMTAMYKATDNASELLKQLTLTYNKARQASITNEILEIVSGANALGK